MMKRLLGPELSALDAVLALSAGLIVSIWSAVVLYHLVERPSVQWSHFGTVQRASELFEIRNAKEGAIR